MLKIDEIAECETSEVLISSDVYIPIDIKFFPMEKDLTLYWRAGRGKKSLLEIGISKNTKKLKSCTLVLLDKNSVNFFLDKKISLNNEKIGVPLFDISIWKKEKGEYIDNFVENFNLPLSASIYCNLILISFNENDPSFFIKYNNNISLGISKEGELINLVIKNTPKEDFERFCENLGYCVCIARMSE